MQRETVIILGGGPAGLTTAIQLKRYGITPRLLERKRLGGLLWNANLVENYPGFPQGISGPALVAQLETHYHSLGLSHTPQEATEVDYDGEFFLVSTPQTQYQTRALVIATGTRPIAFPPEFVPPEAQPQVIYEVADIAQVEKKHIAIIGAGDAAFDYAIQLSRRNTVTILNRGDKVKALPLLVTRSRDIETITYLDHVQVNSLHHENDKLNLQGTHAGKPFSHRADYLLGAIGREENFPPCTPSFQLVEHLLIENNKLHYIGDVSKGIFRQTAIAVGDGLKSAMQIYQFFMEVAQ